ncbi:MAG TPA: methyltransferase [Candidatus Blautia intestinavium]|nr:methyltransferase [Candidatus Blautia intestinavium]
MKEKIGKVVLDDTYYPGEDLYSDGAVEDEMLDIARTYPENKWNQVIAQRKSWPVLYHFSHIRENIISWLPFTGEENVLEIGSGCGAVTGALCKRAKKVTCIELSKKRSQINAWRHRKFGNLTILMGNFQEIERSLTEEYDYITLIGVFEYGENYIDSSTPFVDFLRTVAAHLKPEGKIILAIENRFGLKYWAGCTEDHFGTLFEGLEGYPTTKGVKTFTKKELSGILEKAGGLKASWYYPFPDYKLPMTVFSDRRLPLKGEMNRMETNYDRLRLQLFQESPVYDSLLENDLFPEFSNSFLLLIGKEESCSQTVYVKFSNERDRRFSLRTEICEAGKYARFVRKVPETEEAQSHVRNLENIERELTGLYEKEGMELNFCRLEKDGARLEYLEGTTLEERLDGLLKKGEIEKLEELLFFYLKKIRNIHSRSIFQKTPEFVKVFGDAELEGELRCGGISNIDIVPANILIQQDRVVILDYEWTFRFPVPCNFILYRMIHYYLESDGKRRILKERNFYEKAGISEKEQKIYAGMEKHFQAYIEGSHVSLLSLYDEVSPGKVEILPIYEKMRIASAERRLQVFYDRGRDFREEDSVSRPMGKQGAAAEIEIPEGVRRIRLDPGEASGGLIIRKLCYENGGKAAFTSNGFPLGGGAYYFGGGDPQFILEKIPAGARKLQIEIEIMKEPEAEEAFWRSLSRVSAEKDAEIAALKEKIRQMENTKVWKIYRSLKK